MQKHSKTETMVRINSRILKEQSKYVKRYAKLNKIAEADVVRLAIAEFISNNKK